MKTHSKLSRIMAALLSAIMLLTILLTGLLSSLAVSAADSGFESGRGSSADPYIISTAAQLDMVRNQLSAHYKLDNDIDLSEYLSEGGGGYAKWDINGWEAIGDNSKAFTGSFDGANYKITGLKINRTYSGTKDVYVGLFGKSNGIIKNLGIANCDIKQECSNRYYNLYSGSLVAYQEGGEIANCYSAGFVTANCTGTGINTYIGGLVGYQKYRDGDSVIKDCFSTSRVFVTNPGTDYVGGLIGYQLSNGQSEKSILSNSYSAGSVTYNGKYVFGGGLIGFVSGYYGNIDNCYSTASIDISGEFAYIGGLIGEVKGYYNSIKTCYAGGKINAAASRSLHAGGFIGFLDGMVNIAGGYFDKDATGRTNGVGYGSSNGVTGLNTPEMSGANASDKMNGFDFATNWLARGDITSCCGKVQFYPQLKVFANSTDEYTAAMSQISTIAAKDFSIPENELPFIEGKGSIEDPYKICTPEQLNHVHEHLNASYKLNNDVDLSALDLGSEGWQPIGDQNNSFKGYFEGDNHKVTGLWINRSGEDYVGLFGKASGEIKNLGIEIDDSKDGIIGKGRTGGLVGLYESGSIENSYVTGSVTGYTYTGGLVGLYQSGSIENCYATGSVTSTNTTSNIGWIGGLVGEQHEGSIENCYATSSVTGSGESIGGLVGSSPSGSIANSYASGDVTGDKYTGGLVGNKSYGSIENCYATSSVTGSGESIGGLVGFFAGSIKNSYATGSVTGNGESTGGLVGKSCGSIQNSYATGSVDGTRNTGGLVGEIQGSINNCYAMGSVTSSEDNTGGLVGKSCDSIKNSYATGSVEGSAEYVGGLLGYNTVDGSIKNCYFDKKRSGNIYGVGNDITTESVTGLTTAEMVKSDALTTSMADLGTVNWSKRTATNDDCYYPELAVFYEDGALDSIQKKASEASVRLARLEQSVGQIATPGEIYSGQALTLDEPTIEEGTETITSKGWQISETDTDWTNFDPDYTLNTSYSGKKIRYYVTSDLSTVYSNTVQIKVNKCNPSLTLKASPDLTPTYPTEITLTAKLMGADTNAGKYVNFLIGGTTIQQTTDANGIAILDVTIDAGPHTIEAIFDGDSENNFTSDSINYTIEKANQTISFEETDPEKTYSSDFRYTNKASGGAGIGTISYEITGGTGVASINTSTGEISNVSKSGTIIVIATKLKDTNYNEAKASYTLTINKADQDNLVIDPIAPVYYGDSVYMTTSGGSGTGAFTWSSSDTKVAAVDNGNLTAVGAGKTIITVIRSGDDNYKDSAKAEYSLEVMPKPVTISGVTVKDKTYNGSTQAEITFSGTLVGVFETDDVSIMTGFASFEDKNVGADKTVSFSSFSLTGEDELNYILESQPENITAEITQKPLTIDVTIADKAYNGLNNATIQSAALVGVEGSDDVILTNGTATFSTTATGENIPINFTSDFSITGTDAGNYNLIQPTGVTGRIIEGFTPIKDAHYTLSVPDGTDGWYVAEVFTITAKSGYKVSLGNLDASDWQDSMTYSDEIADGSVSFYVRNTDTNEISIVQTEGYKLDKTAPTGEIEIKSNSFKSFLNTITFGLFFKDTVDVNITGTDETSGIASKEYIKTDTEMDLDALEKAVWTSYDSMSVQANEAFIIYARITDKAGNAVIINSDGVVVYTDSAQDTKNISYTRTSGEDVTAKVKLNGNTVSEITNGEDALILDEDYTVDNTGIITFKANYLETIAAGDYTLTISYSPMGYDYDDTEGNEAPATTTITLHVVKASQSISGLEDTTKTYGDTPFNIEPTAAGNPVFTFESDNTDVANVDEYGKVTIIGVGSTTITVSAAATDDYEATMVSFSLTVNKATLTVTTDDVSRKYGEENPEFTVHINGFVNGEDESVLAALPTAACVAEKTSETRKYDIILSGGESSNYVFSYINGTLTVTADTSALEKAIEDAEKLNKDGYTSESWQNLQGALTEGKTILIKDNVTQAEVDTVAKAINDAIQALKVKDTSSSDASNTSNTPKPPNTSDKINLWLWFTLATASFVVLLLLRYRKSKIKP